jgi:hypothetical protein
MSKNIGVVIVEKTGVLKNLCIKSFSEDDLYKKCGFKSKENFIKHHEWRIRKADLTYIISLYGKDAGKAMSENKYDFPPPVDNTLFFGNCVIVCHTSYKGESGDPLLETININLWEKLYEKLFGGFEDLTATQKEDEDEVDELENISADKKTKEGGYLKDGFVVDDVEDDDTSDTEEDNESDEFGTCEGESEETSDDVSYETGSELSEESYIVET